MGIPGHSYVFIGIGRTCCGREKGTGSGAKRRCLSPFPAADTFAGRMGTGASAYGYRGESPFFSPLNTYSGPG